MKKLLISLLLCLMPCTSIAGDLTKTDIALEGAYLTVHAIDYLQTRYIAKNYHKEMPNGELLEEMNPYLGPQPSIDSVNKFFIISSTLHVGVTYALRKFDVPDYIIRTWQIFTIYDASKFVVGNYHLGVKLSF